MKVRISSNVDEHERVVDAEHMELTPPIRMMMSEYGLVKVVMEFDDGRVVTYEAVEQE